MRKKRDSNSRDINIRQNADHKWFSKKEENDKRKYSEQTKLQNVINASKNENCQRKGKIPSLYSSNFA